jgi:hypothetical protein
MEVLMALHRKYSCPAGRYSQAVPQYSSLGPNAS